MPARALKHIRDADSVASAYESAKPYEIRREATDRPGEVAFRFRLLKPVPVELLTIIGDAIHNMRSSLDSVAFELARQQLGGTMTDRQERAAQFPIAQDRAGFDDFFDSHKFRMQMYGQRERDTMRCVQPFASKGGGSCVRRRLGYLARGGVPHQRTRPLEPPIERRQAQATAT